VAWRDDRKAPNEIIATRVRPDGTVLDPAGIEVTGWTPATGSPSVASDGTDFLVVFSGGNAFNDPVWVIPDHFRVRAAIINSYGGLTSEIDLEPATATATPVVAFNGTNYLVVTAETSGDLTAILVNPQGAPLTSAMLASRATGRRPAVVGLAGRVLVGWQDGALLVDDRGTITGLDVSSLPSGETSVATDGVGFLLARTTPDGVVSARIDADGTVLDPAGVRVPGSGGPPAVAFAGSWLVVWNDRRETGGGPGIYGVRIRQDGSVVDPAGFLIAAGVAGDPDAIAPPRGGRWRVAYSDYDASTFAHRVFIRTVAPK